jgi:hypothetical protein
MDEDQGLNICRDAFPDANVIQLRDLMLDLTARSVLARHSKIIIRKLFVTVRVILILNLHRIDALLVVDVHCAKTLTNTSITMARLGDYVCDISLRSRSPHGIPLGFSVDCR